MLFRSAASTGEGKAVAADFAASDPSRLAAQASIESAMISGYMP